MGLTAEDRLAIQDLLIKYTHFNDAFRPVEEFLDIVTDDVVFDGAGGTFVGTEGIRTWWQDLLQESYNTKAATKTATRHNVMNILVEGDGDHATMTAYLYLARSPLQPAEDWLKTEYRPTIGSYECEARKVAGKWRLSRRTVTPEGYYRAASRDAKG